VKSHGLKVIEHLPTLNSYDFLGYDSTLLLKFLVGNQDVLKESTEVCAETKVKKNNPCIKKLRSLVELLRSQKFVQTFENCIGIPNLNKNE